MARENTALHNIDTEEENENGFHFLQEVKEKLKNRLRELEEELSTGQKEIENMQEYYWENYAEMDQYGYEDYDNRQALLHQVNANQEKSKRRHRYEKMLDAPFFGRVDFLFDGEDIPEKFYIGIGNFAERAGLTPLIYDWRAPVSGLFYDYDKGRASYEAPGGVMTGEIVSKWQYKIKNGEMVYAFESDTKIDDEILKEELGNSSDVKLKNIVRTIQREQNEIIRNTKDKILVIQGGAGSGKTSVALHRIAYLLYHERNTLSSSDILILSPNSVFADYISHILPELGEENIKEMSFDLFAYRHLQDIASDCEDRYDYLERLMRFSDTEERSRFQRKQSAEYAGEMEGFMAGLEDGLMDFKELEFRGMNLTEEELIRLFYFRFQEIPLLARMEAVMEYFIDAYETLKGGDISEEDREYLKRRFGRMYVTQDIYDIYNHFLQSIGCDPLPDVPCERRKIPYEDVYPMLYMKYRLRGNGQNRRIRHLVIDEMQDYSYVQYTILKELFTCKMTILGDRAQTLDTEQQDVLTFLPKIFGKDIRKIVMNKSYRNTVEIAEYASALSGVTDMELLERHGAPVIEKQLHSEEELIEEIVKNLETGMDGYETAAVITMTEVEAYDVYRLLKKKQRLRESGTEINYIDRNSSVFKKGVTVTTFYLAKGLEFDKVFMARLGGGNMLTGQAEYIAATRALHELYMLRVAD